MARINLLTRNFKALETLANKRYFGIANSMAESCGFNVVIMRKEEILNRLARENNNWLFDIVSKNAFDNLDYLVPVTKSSHINNTFACVMYLNYMGIPAIAITGANYENNSICIETFHNGLYKLNACKIEDNKSYLFIARDGVYTLSANVIKDNKREWTIKYDNKRACSSVYLAPNFIKKYGVLLDTDF